MAKGPAPKGEYSGKSSVFSTRIRPDLRERLDDAARQSGRSLSQEIEHRLRRSFVEDDKIVDGFGDRQTYRLMRMIADAIHMSNRPDANGETASWLDDARRFDIALSAAKSILEAVRPHGPALEADIAAAAEAVGVGIASDIWLGVEDASSSINLSEGNFRNHLNAVARSDIGEDLTKRMMPAIRVAFYKSVGGHFPDLMEEIMANVEKKSRKEPDE